jgi:hypothetical protein
MTRTKEYIIRLDQINKDKIIYHWRNTFYNSGNYMV